MAAGASMSSEKADHSTLTEDDVVGASLQPPFEMMLAFFIEVETVTPLH